nr:uncharacterized protein LOC118682775 [Bactrocera oleae]
MRIDALVLSSITSPTPAVKIDINQWPYLRDIDLPDNRFGTDVWGRLIEGKVIGGGPDEPFAQRTRFGWVVFGPTAVTLPAKESLLTLTTSLDREDHRLEELVSKFWQMEEIAVVDDLPENKCAQIFETTHSRTLDGRYIVHLPLRRKATELGDSYALELRQFHRLERHMVADPVLRENYISFMREYAALGHMELVQPSCGHNEVSRGVQRFGTYQHWNLTERCSTGRSDPTGFAE